MDYQFANDEERILAENLERRIDSKIKKSLNNMNGDSGKTKIDLGSVPPQHVMDYLLDRFNKCSLTAKNLGRGMLEITYNLHR